MSIRVFQLLTVRLPAALEDEVMGQLYLAGTLGCEARDEAPGRLAIVAWFDEVPPPELLAGWAEQGVEVVGVAPLAEQDWLGGYRAQVRPFALGRGFFVDPREPDEAAVEVPAGRALLRLPARTAFGIGSHESTRLALELLEDTPVAGCRVLDVGTGTGILAFAAEALGAASVTAFDIDPVAALVARENQGLNRAVVPRAPRFFAGEINALAPSARFDLLLVNVIPAEVAAVFAELANRLSPRGRWIFSGVLLEQEAELTTNLAPLGLEPEARHEEGEWVAVRFRRV
jgi:ribosomal protein L11 methyltransferase